MITIYTFSAEVYMNETDTHTVSVKFPCDDDNADEFLEKLAIFLNNCTDLNVPEGMNKLLDKETEKRSKGAKK